SKWAVVSVVVPLGAALVFTRRPLRYSPRPTWAFAALVACLAVAAVGGLDPVYAWTGTPERHFGVLTWALCAVAFLAGQSMDVDHDGVLVARGAVLAGLGVGTVATLEASGWEPSLLDVDGRLTGTFGSAA